MNGTAVSIHAVAAVTTDTQQTAVASIAAASKRLKELSHLLDTQGLRAAPEVGANLHVLAQQLQGLQHIAEAEHTANSLARQASTAAAAHTGVAGSTQNISKTGATGGTAAADVKALERSYAAPAAAGAAECDDAAAMQPLTKKQRRGEEIDGAALFCVALTHCSSWSSGQHHAVIRNQQLSTISHCVS
jgi:hypothetical protein